MERERLKEVLSDVKAETLRFLKKLDECEKQDKTALQYGSHKNGAVRRAALDLKKELTRITQANTY